MMAFGSGLHLAGQLLKPENQEELQILLSIGKDFAKRFGKSTPELSQEMAQQVSSAIQEHRGGQGGQYPSMESFGRTSGSQSETMAPLYPAQDRALGAANYDQPLDQRPEYNPEIERAMADAKVQHGGDFSLGDMTTFDKIAGGVGAATLGLSLAGVGGRKGRDVLMPISKAASRYAMGAPGRYYDREKRALGREMAPLQAESNIYDAQKETYTDLDASQRDWNRIGLGASALGLEASEQDMREEGKYNRPGSAENLSQMSAAILRDALLKGRITQEELDNAARQYALRSVEGVPLGTLGAFGGTKEPPQPEEGMSEANIRRGRAIAEKRLKKAESKVISTIAKQDRGLATRWAKMLVSDEDILLAARSGELMIEGGWGKDNTENTELVNVLLEVQQWGDPSFVQQWLDDEAGYRAEFPEVKKTARGTAASEVLGTLPAWATKLGLTTKKAAKAHLDSIRSTIGEQDYQAALKQLGN